MKIEKKVALKEGMIVRGFNGEEHVVGAISADRKKVYLHLEGDEDEIGVLDRSKGQLGLTFTTECY
jgi:hypothetical protein